MGRKEQNRDCYIQAGSGHGAQGNKSRPCERDEFRLIYARPSRAGNRRGSSLEVNGTSRYNRFFLNPECTLCRVEISAALQGFHVFVRQILS